MPAESILAVRKETGALTVMPISGGSQPFYAKDIVVYNIHPSEPTDNEEVLIEDREALLYTGYKLNGG
ncbi:MAG: hypothetical protein U9N81_05805 [Bacillota bacterium]|nr:hypothetical protein [Bacillota bacterium]